jgi:regulator of sigma D
LLLQQTIDVNPWLKTDKQIEQWLIQRQILLVIYNQICQTKHSSQSHSKLQTLHSFCQVLMDYLSAGHFKIFEKLATAYQTDNSTSQSMGISNQLLEKILTTTDVALDFNDKYTDPADLNELSKDLSTLGENLAHRMEWEDSLVNTYLQLTKH